MLRWLFPLVLVLAQTPARQTFFQTPFPPAETKGKQAVVETSHGRFVIQLLAEVAPNHVVTVMQKGYRLHERLLRPAMVVVSRAATGA